MSLPRYPEYKDSGVRWLGDVPVCWIVLGARRVFEEIREPASSEDDQLSATQRYGVIPQKLFMEAEDQKVVLALSGTSSFKHVKKDDFVISLRSFQGGIEHSAYTGCVSPAYTVLRARNPIVPRYWAYLFKCSSYISALQTVTAGIRDGKSISYTQFGSLEVPVPPAHEQEEITTFLDRETAKIDALIAEQEKLLALLAEKRQATISHAVTRGLNPNAPMKDSGIPWLGEVPVHWDVMALGRVTTSKCDGPFGSGLKSDHYVDEGSRVVRLQNIRGGRFDDRDAAFIEREYFESELARHEVREGDLLIAGLGDDNNVVGRACVAPQGIYPALVKADCFRFRLNLDRVLPQFAAWALTVGSTYDAGVLSSGSTRSRIPLSVMATRKIPLPPVGEQLEINRHIDALQVEFDQLTTSAEQAIELLRERRSALISAAVTGKIDVRQAA